MSEENNEETYEEESIEEEPYEEESYEDTYEESHKEPRKRLITDDFKRKVLAYSIVFIVAFASASAIVGFSLMVKENKPRNELAKTDYYMRSIIPSFDIEVFNSTILSSASYFYEFNNTNSTFGDCGGLVGYFDILEDVEYMSISFDAWASESSIESITFHIGEKSQLNIIIFADGREVYNALKIKNDISIEFQLFAIELIAYVF